MQCNIAEFAIVTMESIRLAKNKIRIWLLSWPVIGRLFGRTVKRIEIKTPDGKEHKVTVEQHQEKVCQHKRIEEITNAIYKCMDCGEAYFFITYKVMGTAAEVIKFTEDLVKHFKLHDHEEDKR